MSVPGGADRGRAARRRSSGAAVPVVTVLVLLALTGFALVLVDAQRSARADIEGRLQDRADAGAALIGSVFTASAGNGRQTHAERYAGPRVPVDRLTRQARDSRSGGLLVADADGRVLAASTGAPARARTVLAGRPGWFRAALRDGGFGLSDAADGAVPGTPSFAQSFPTPTGPRVLVSILDPQVLAEFFAGSLARLPAVAGGRTFLLDGDGAVLSGPQGERLGATVQEPGLLAAVRAGDRGDLDDEDFFAASVVNGTPWRVVLTAPSATLFESVEGRNKWGPWALFAAFGLAALGAVALLARVAGDARRIAGANGRLSDANAALATANVELERSNAELERFASIASHDLREPLRKVQMFSERVLHHEQDRLSDRGRDYLHRIDGAGQRMQVLIDGLLTYARVTTRPEPLEDVDLHVVAREVADDLEAARLEVGGTIEIGPLPRVPAEPLRMRQLLQNLISNGLRFHRDGVPPVVRVTGRTEGDDVVLEVADNGIGLEARHADRVFELFGRLHPRGTYDGTGLGLALCRRIAERHGGSITVASTPGAGSTFSVRLPRTPADGPAGTPEPPKDHLVHA